MTVRLVFLDDSVQREPIPRRGMGELVAVGAVVVPEGSVKPYADDLASIKAEIGVPADEEIKWKPKKGTFLGSASGADVQELRRRLLQAALDREIRSAVVIWDRGRVPWERDRVAPTILGYLYERVEMHLNDHQALGMIIADKPGGGHAEDAKWLAASLPLTESGTTNVKAEQVVLPIVTAASDHVPHLQLADLVVAATTAAVAGRKSGLDLAPLLNQLAHQNSCGGTAGAGVVLWPPELYNLHHWVFGENTYWKVGRNIGLPLPHPGWSYATDDGLDTTSTPPAGQAEG
jgi:hypothetical protein